MDDQTSLVTLRHSFLKKKFDCMCSVDDGQTTVVILWQDFECIYSAVVDLKIPEILRQSNQMEFVYIYSAHQYQPKVLEMLSVLILGFDALS